MKNKQRRLFEQRPAPKRDSITDPITHEDQLKDQIKDLENLGKSLSIDLESRLRDAAKAAAEKAQKEAEEFAKKADAIGSSTPRTSRAYTPTEHIPRANYDLDDHEINTAHINRLEAERIRRISHGSEEENKVVKDIEHQNKMDAERDAAMLASKRKGEFTYRQEIDDINDRSKPFNMLGINVGDYDPHNPNHVFAHFWNDFPDAEKKHWGTNFTDGIRKAFTPGGFQPKPKAAPYNDDYNNPQYRGMPSVPEANPHYWEVGVKTPLPPNLDSKGVVDNIRSNSSSKYLDDFKSLLVAISQKVHQHPEIFGAGLVAGVAATTALVIGGNFFNKWYAARSRKNGKYKTDQEVKIARRNLAKMNRNQVKGTVMKTKKDVDSLVSRKRLRESQDLIAAAINKDTRAAKDAFKEILRSKLMERFDVIAQEIINEDILKRG